MINIKKKKDEKVNVLRQERRENYEKRGRDTHTQRDTERMREKEREGKTK